MKTLADEVGFTAYRLEQAFRAVYGESVARCVQRWRLEYPQARLRAGHCSIKEVAYDLGYGNPANFTRAYRRVFGKPPSKGLASTVARSGPA